jgi:LacI family transcriptional regulator
MHKIKLIYKTLLFNIKSVDKSKKDCIIISGELRYKISRIKLPTKNVCLRAEVHQSRCYEVTDFCWGENKMKNKVSMQDIADQVGVSKVTVSKVLRGQSDVSEAMCDKVLEVAKTLGYIYKGGRMLEGAEISKVVVLTLEHFFGTNSFYIKMFRALSESFDNLGVDTKLVILDNASEKAMAFPEAVTTKAIDGIIVMGQFSREYLGELQKSKIPLIFLDFYYDGFDVPSVITDNFFGAYEITSLLIKQGHRKIGFVGNINFTSSIQDRFLGYYKALLEYNIPLNGAWILNDRSEEGVWMEIPLPAEMPTAFFCNCDEVAFLLTNSLKQHGFRVPEDISIAGFDDSVHSTLSDPPITTVHVSIEDMAHLAVKTLLKKVKSNSGGNNRVLLKGKLILRKSVSKPSIPPRSR